MLAWQNADGSTGVEEQLSDCQKKRGGKTWKVDEESMSDMKLANKLRRNAAPPRILEQKKNLHPSICKSYNLIDARVIRNSNCISIQTLI